MTADPTAESVERLKKLLTGYDTLRLSDPSAADPVKVEILRWCAVNLWSLVTAAQAAKQECERLKGLNNVLSEKLERRTLTLSDAEAKLSALEEAVGQVSADLKSWDTAEAHRGARAYKTPRAAYRDAAAMLDLAVTAAAPEPRSGDVVRLRPEVLAFAHLMEAKLQANDHKGTWKFEAADGLLRRCNEELLELYVAVNDAREQNVGGEAADVANFAMMIADVCGALAASPVQGGAL